MQQVKKRLEARENYLSSIKNEKEKKLEEMPEGTLRICKHGNRTQYYHRKDPKDVNGVYIREEDYKIAQELAQKDYDQRVIQAIDKEKKVIEKFLYSYPEANAEKIYEKMSKERQKLILPITESEEEFVQRWESVTYEGKGFDEGSPEYYTSRGERVRSKSEVIIADLLLRLKIPYRYEYPIYLRGLGIVHPDFTLLDIKKRREIYLEHMGQMDRPQYATKAVNRIAVYEKNGIYPGDKLILTFETEADPLNQKLVQSTILHYIT